MPTPSANAWLAAIVSSSNDAIISKNLDGVVTSWNHAAERLFGYTAAEMVGRPIAGIAAPGREVEMADILERIRRGERLDHFETQRRHKDGHLVDISLTVSPILDGDGTVIGASKIARDITEQKRAAERLVTLAREVDHRAKNIMAAALSWIRLTRTDTVENLRMTLEGRIGALAAVHVLIARNAWDGATVRDVLDAIFATPEPRVRVRGPRYFVLAAAVDSLGKTFHELASNAEKHGALSAPGGSVDVTLFTDLAGNLVIDWKERGGPRVVPPDRQGFGARMIAVFVPHELQGDARLMWEPDGVRCRIVVPRDHVSGALLEKHAADVVA